MLIYPADSKSVARAGALIRDGELVAFPTETVYGLGADATNGRAVAAIYEAKGRPRFNPLIAHVASVEAAASIGALGGLARDLINAFWPGPLTLVVPRARSCRVSELATAGHATIAIRCPAHPVATALIEAADCPIVAPSANRSGHVSATMAQHVAEDLGPAVSMILDGGACEIGLESTIAEVSGTEVAILREGAITADALARVAGTKLAHQTEPTHAPRAPGQLASHYAPNARLFLDVADCLGFDALLAFGVPPESFNGPIRNLSATGNLREAAANLFAHLRELDATGATTIAAMPIPETGLGAAINDRLRRAAAPRCNQ